MRKQAQISNLPKVTHLSKSARDLNLDQAPESIFFIYFCKFLIGGQLLYNIVLVSAVQQHESALSIHISPPY